MRRTASEVIRNLEMRIARLERQAMKPADPASRDAYRQVIKELKLDRNPLTDDYGVSLTKNNKSIDALVAVLLKSTSATGTVEVKNLFTKFEYTQNVRMVGDLMDWIGEGMKVFNGSLKITLLGMKFTLTLKDTKAYLKLI